MVIRETDSMDQQARWEEHLNNNPLMLFSLYTDIQFNMVKVLGEEIIQCMDETISVDGEGHVRIQSGGKYTDEAYSKFWFWSLGAYEVVRTMCEAKKCFAPGLLAQLNELKQTLGKLRIPFAKQELKGEKVPVHAELSITINGSPPDYKYRVKEEVISTREMIGKFDAMLNGIKRVDILAPFNAMYPSRDSR